MPGAFLHTPQRIVQQLLIDRGLASDPAYWADKRPGDDLSDAPAWPAFKDNTPDAPDNLIRVQRTTDRFDVRILATGQNVKHFGIQLLVRGTDGEVAGVKQLALDAALSEQLNDQTVTIDGQSYLVQSFPQVQSLPGYRSDLSSVRETHSINCLAVIIPHPIQG